jgi:hypothetical protein
MAITYGQTLANSTLSGGAGSVPGSFAFTSPATAPAVGTALQSIAFEPTDSANYHSVTGSVSVTVATVVIPPVINSLTTSNGTVGTPFSYVITATNNATGFSASTLPAWLTLNSTTGVLSGTPIQSEVFEITLTATNTAGTDTETLRIKIEAESSVFESIKFLGGASLPNGGEIVSFAENLILTTNSTNGSHAVQIYNLNSNSSISPTISANMDSVFSSAENIHSVTSVVADTRGFGVATIVPIDTSVSGLGRVAIFNTTNGLILKTLDFGYNPDSDNNKPDGAKLLVTNEG